MADFLGNLVGNDGIAKVVGEKVGDVVEDTVNKVLSGKGGENKEEEKKKEGGGGFDVGDVLSLAGGNKDKEKGGGVDVGNMVSGLFK